MERRPRRHRLALSAMLMCIAPVARRLDPYVGVWHRGSVTVYTSLPASKIVSDYQAGESLLNLATRHGVAKGTIRRVLANADVPTRSGGYRATPMDQPRPVRERVHRPSREPVDLLHPQEVAWLRRAIGWTVDWTSPYDRVRGD